jgi:hypothetical protein
MGGSGTGVTIENMRRSGPSAGSARRSGGKTNCANVHIRNRTMLRVMRSSPASSVTPILTILHTGKGSNRTWLRSAAAAKIIVADRSERDQKRPQQDRLRLWHTNYLIDTKDAVIVGRYRDINIRHRGRGCQPTGLGGGHALSGDTACDGRFVHSRRARWAAGDPIERGLTGRLSGRLSRAAGAADAARAYGQCVFRRLFVGRSDDRLGERRQDDQALGRRERAG